MMSDDLYKSIETALDSSIAVYQRRKKEADDAAAKEAAAAKASADADQTIRDAWAQPREALNLAILSTNERLQRINVQFQLHDVAIDGDELAAAEVRTFLNSHDTSKSVRVSVARDGKVSTTASGLHKSLPSKMPDVRHCGGYQWQTLLLQPLIDILVVELPVT